MFGIYLLYEKIGHISSFDIIVLITYNIAVETKFGDNENVIHGKVSEVRGRAERA